MDLREVAYAIREMSDWLLEPRRKPTAVHCIGRAVDLLFVIPRTLWRDMGLFGVLNEIANSEEEGKYFLLQSFLLLQLALPLHNLLNSSQLPVGPAPFPSPISPGPVVYVGIIFTSPLYRPRIPELVSRALVGWKDLGSTHPCSSFT